MTNIILINYRSIHHTISCLESLLLLRETNKIFLVDNCSDDDSEEIFQKWVEGKTSAKIPANIAKIINSPVRQHVPLKSLEVKVWSEKKFISANLKECKKINFIKAEKNYGFGGGANIVLEKFINLSEEQYLWLLNNDTIVTGSTLRELLQNCKLSGWNGFLGSSLFYMHVPNKLQSTGAGQLSYPWLLTSHSMNFSAPVDYIVGASLLTTTTFLKQIGLLPGDFFLYYEDVAWSVAAKRGGGYLKIVPTSIVYHAEGGSDQKQRDETRGLTTDFYSLRNRLLLAQRYYPLCIPFVWVTLWGSLVRRLMSGSWVKAYCVFIILWKQPFRNKRPLTLQEVC